MLLKNKIWEGYSYKLEEKSYIQFLYTFSNLEDLHGLILWLNFYIRFAPKKAETEDYRKVLLSSCDVVKATT